MANKETMTDKFIRKQTANNYDLTKHCFNEVKNESRQVDSIVKPIAYVLESSKSKIGKADPSNNERLVVILERSERAPMPTKEDEEEKAPKSGDKRKRKRGPNKSIKMQIVLLNNGDFLLRNSDGKVKALITSRETDDEVVDGAIFLDILMKKLKLTPRGKKSYDEYEPNIQQLAFQKLVNIITLMYQDVMKRFQQVNSTFDQKEWLTTITQLQQLNEEN